MKEIKSSLDKILVVLGIYRLERDSWPLDAVELQSFGNLLGKSLDFSNYHRFRFLPKTQNEVILDFCLLSKNEWTLGGQAVVRIQQEVPFTGHTLPLEVRIQTLVPQKMEAKSYCLLEETRLSGKLSA